MAATVLWLGAAALATLSADGVVQLLTVAMIVAAAVPVLRSRAKDATLQTQTELAESRAEKIKDLEADLRGCKARADDGHRALQQAERRSAKLEGQLEEQSKYTAKEAFEAIAGELGAIKALLSTWIAQIDARDIDSHS